MHWNFVIDGSTLNGIETTRGSTMKALNRVYITITMDLGLLMVSCAVVGGLAAFLLPFIV